MVIGRFFGSAFAALVLTCLSQAATLQPPAQTAANSCVSCHLDLGGEMAAPVESMGDDIHAKRGLSCQHCHGGDPTLGFDGDLYASMDPDKGFRSDLKRTDIPRLCAECHSDPAYMRGFNPRMATDQYSRYLTSVHGQRLQEGDDKVAVCTDCHGTHDIHSARDARSSVYALNLPATCAHCHSDEEHMAGYEIPTDQFDQYRQSVHGHALLELGDQAAPACNDCHGNHGASPPGAPSIAYVCGQCHLNNSELFLASPHRDAFALVGFPECETCHGNHLIQHPSDDMLAAGETNVCAECHTAESEQYEIATAMHGSLTSLAARIHEAETVVSKAERAGMPVAEAQFKLADADDALIKARTVVHSLSDEEVAGTTAEGMTLAGEALSEGVHALEELEFRRKGLAVSVIFLALLAVGLILKIREVDRRLPPSEER